MSAYDKILSARSKGRPTGTAYIEKIFDSFIELHGAGTLACPTRRAIARPCG